MTVSRLIFKLLYPFCCSDTKLILGNMDTKAEIIQRCVDDKLKDDIARTWDFNSEAPPPDDFEKWVNILEAGTFNPIERIAIKAALYNHKREATRKIIYSTLVGGGYTSKKEEDYRDHPDPEMDEYCGQLQGHLKGYPGYEDEPIHPHYGDDPTQELEEILKDCFGEENQCK